MGVLVFKMGAVPLHGWFLRVSSKMRWERLYLFLTVQKFIPLFILSQYAATSQAGLSVIRWAVAGLGRLKTKRIKKLFIYSSLFFMGALLALVRLVQF